MQKGFCPAFLILYCYYYNSLGENVWIFLPKFRLFVKKSRRLFYLFSRKGVFLKKINEANLKSIESKPFDKVPFYISTPHLYYHLFLIMLDSGERVTTLR